ncbi:transposase [Endozoicomonas sp. SCSIO W0465]|uniref:transposase n=1 Tax=Endozoicomonas sp. SCSIO W0465 TaxID=2918516 RepID=UPI0035322D5B
MIISILIYAYSHGVFSSREIERRCNQDLAFMYIAKQHCQISGCSVTFVKTRPPFLKAVSNRACCSPGNYRWPRWATSLLMVPNSKPTHQSIRP